MSNNPQQGASPPAHLPSPPTAPLIDHYSHLVLPAALDALRAGQSDRVLETIRLPALCVSQENLAALASEAFRTPGSLPLLLKIHQHSPVALFAALKQYLDSNALAVVMFSNLGRDFPGLAEVLMRRLPGDRDVPAVMHLLTKAAHFPSAVFPYSLAEGALKFAATSLGRAGAREKSFFEILKAVANHPQSGITVKEEPSPSALLIDQVVHRAIATFSREELVAIGLQLLTMQNRQEALQTATDEEFKAIKRANGFFTRAPFEIPIRYGDLNATPQGQSPVERIERIRCNFCQIDSVLESLHTKPPFANFHIWLSPFDGLQISPITFERSYTTCSRLIAAASDMPPHALLAIDQQIISALSTLPDPLILASESLEISQFSNLIRYRLSTMLYSREQKAQSPLWQRVHGALIALAAERASLYEAPDAARIMDVALALFVAKHAFLADWFSTNPETDEVSGTRFEIAAHNARVVHAALCDRRR